MSPIAVSSTGLGLRGKLWDVAWGTRGWRVERRLIHNGVCLSHVWDGIRNRLLDKSSLIREDA